LKQRHGNGVKSTDRRPITSFVDRVETGHISLNIDHIFQWSKAVILKHI